MRRHDIADSADLLAVLSAIGHPVQDSFDPQRFLEAFSHHLEGIIPHDSVMIAYLEDEGRTSTVFARMYPFDSLRSRPPCHVSWLGFFARPLPEEHARAGEAATRVPAWGSDPQSH